MTLLFLLTLICFSTTLSLGITAGKEAGVVGILIGIGVGLVVGGLAYYALKKTANYSYELRRKSQPQVIKVLIDWVTGVWTVLLLVVAGFLASFSTEFIVQ